MMLPAIGAGGQMFAPVLKPTQRMAAAHRQPSEAHILRQKNAFVAKAAADVRRDDPHLRLHQPQTFGEAGAHDMGHLAARIQNELVHAAVPIGDRAAALHRSHALAGGGNLASNLDRSVERGFDIDVDERLKERVVAPVLVQERRVRRGAPPACRARPAAPRDRPRRSRQYPQPRPSCARRTSR